MQKKYQIRDLEEITGIKAHTIRIWEKRYNLIQPERTDTNIRYYDEASLKKFLLITKLYNSGIKISDISKLSSKQIQEKVLLFYPEEAGFEDWSVRLLSAIVDYDNFLFDKIINDCLLSFDLDKVISLFLVPFVHKIDTLWKGESISIYQKKFALEKIRKFLSKIYYSVSVNYPQTNKQILVIVEDDDFSSFIIRYVDIILRKNGYNTIFLGSINNLSHQLPNLSQICNKIITTASFNSENNKRLIDFVKNNNQTHLYIVDINYLIDEDITNLTLINNFEEMDLEV